MPMTVPEYKAAFDEIRDRQRKELDELNRKFATENSTVKIGDIITDGNRRIKIDDISVTIDWFTDMPQCMYEGVELKKDGTPRKDGNRYSIYQESLKG